MEGKVYLCHSGQACPAVDFTREGVRIGERDNRVVLKKEEWNTLVEKIKSGELRAL